MKFRNLFVVVFICFNYSSYSQNVINCEIEKIIVNDISKCYSKNFNCFMIHRKQISYDSSTMKLDWYKRLVIDEKNDFLIDSVVKLYLIKPFDSCFLESKQFNNFKFKNEDVIEYYINSKQNKIRLNKISIKFSNLVFIDNNAFVNVLIKYKSGYVNSHWIFYKLSKDVLTSKWKIVNVKFLDG